MRNLIEFTKGEEDEDYKLLTSLLHWKEESSSITLDEICRIYEVLFGTRESMDDKQKSIIELINEEAEHCLAAPDGLNFENKIVLSMAIRLSAERHMFDKIANPTECKKIKTNQTYNLLKLFAKSGASSKSAIKIIERVILMTPENIHLNSFMYEPILDMSDEHLRRLYAQVKALQ